jgi:A/G-specific adenine glycosylase
VASIAFGARVGAVDTNVRRVLGRALAGSEQLPAAALQAAADASVDPGRPGDWTHAVMDVGATLCRPARPRCAECPLRPWCRFEAEAADTSTAKPISQRPRARVPEPPFNATRRWLRGRLVDRLREADGPAWTEIRAPIGSHDTPAIDRALAALARDGVVELDPGNSRRARLATV